MSLSDLFDLMFRWTHLIAGIMWIGNSMLFNWLDRNLEKAAGSSRLSQGKLFMVHSGAFYDVEKKLLEPGELPATLHWFKWQNFTTWASGIGLLVTVYYLHGASFLIDPRVANLTPSVAITLSLSSLLTAWLIYDGLWKIYGERNPRMATVISIVMLVGAIIGFAYVFSGRGAYIQVGVLIGTLMTGNVWLCIVPSQHALVDATRAGKPQDATLSVRAKQRSIHNNYFTFPLLFIMISNHFGATYAAKFNWLILIALIVGGAGIRHFMNVRYLGEGKVRSTGAFLAPAAAMAAIAIAGVMIISRIKDEPDLAASPVSYTTVSEIIARRCSPCHSAHPTDDQFRSPPLNIVFDRPEDIKLHASRIMARAVDSDTMPFNNKTQMTKDERKQIGRWISDGAAIK